MMLSIIIPVTAGREDNLRLNLTALQQQTLDKNLFEVIVVVDSNHDGYAKLSTEFSTIVNKFYTIDKKDFWNASIPRNYGFSKADGDFIMFLDSDIILNYNALLEHMKMMLLNSSRVSIGRYDWLPPMYVTPEDIKNNFDNFSKGKLIKKPHKGGLGHIGLDHRHESFKKQLVPLQSFDTIFDALACFGGNLVMSRQTFEKIGGFDETMQYGVEDGDFGLTAHEKGVRFSYCEKAIGFHNWHELSAVRSQNAGNEVKKLNAKHFPTENEMNISYATGIAYKRWGTDQYPSDWNSLTEEEKNKYKELIRSSVQ